MIAFEKEKKRLSKAQVWPKAEVVRETIELYIELLERTEELRHLRLFLSLMNTLKTICLQKLFVESCTKNILRKSCNSKTSAFTDKCFKAFGVVYGLSELVY